MSVRRIRLLAGVLGLSFVMGAGAEAGFLTRLDYKLHSWRADYRVDKLVVTGNFVKSRLLAELIQRKTRQPLLLVSPTAAGADLYFLPYGQQAERLSMDELVEFVDLADPRQIVFLGGQNYIPSSVVERLQDRKPSVRVGSENWAQNAKTLSNMFEYRKLPEKFARYMRKVANTADLPPDSMEEITY